MEGENIVKLHGSKTSSFSFRVELALKIKGIPYEYVTENLKNKSETLLKYNPVHKKVPVFVHDGKPIAESLVILEYIDEVWKENGPRLLPQDPCTRAKVRFWANFLDQELFPRQRPMLTTEGEAQAKAIKEKIDALKVVEERMLEFLPTTPITSENQLGLLDLVICSDLGYCKAIEEVIGVKLVDPERTPLLFSWMESLLELPAVKEIWPSQEKLVGFIHLFRKYIQAPKA